MLITVTQAMIDEPCLIGPKALNCPVACAIDMVLKPGFVASATEDYLCIFKGNRSNTTTRLKYLRSPASVKQFVREYDRKHKVSPFSFELDIPEEYLK